MGLTVLLSAGGTGGHLFPAQALAVELSRRGHTVDLATDERADQYGVRFPAHTVHIIASETLRGRSPLALARTGVALVRGTLQAMRTIGRIGADIVVGFGGYPTLPPVAAAALKGVPIVLHEGNAVMGRANRLLARRATAIATGFQIGDLGSALAERTVVTGNPVREAVLNAVRPYQAAEGDAPFHLLVFGGSQGARFFSEALPPAIAAMAPAARARLRLTQQCRAEDIERVRQAYAELGVTAELAPFFTDMAERIAFAHLVICRSGASSVSELAVIGRPSILVPLPHALDNDQGVNAAVLESAGGALPVAQSDLSAELLAKMLEDLVSDPARLSTMAAAAREVGRPDAVGRLADLVERVAAGSDKNNQGEQP